VSKRGASFQVKVPGLTIDWIFTGDRSGLTVGIAKLLHDAEKLRGD